MKRFWNILSIYRISIVISISIIILGIVCIIFIKNIDKNNDNLYENDNFILKYDSIWSIDKANSDEVILKHSSHSEINISYLKLTDDDIYTNIEELAEKIKVNIQYQNENYHFIAKDFNVSNLKKYNGYKLLFEDANNQSMIVLLKNSDKLVILILNAENEYFDLLLNSFQNIVYNFEIKEEEIEFTYKLEDISDKKILWKENQNLDSQIIDNQEYTLKQNQFVVDYSLPTVFELVTDNMFKYKENDAEKSLYLSTSLLSLNIYEYLEQLKNGQTIEISSIKNNPEYYKNIQDNVQKLSNEIPTYIYLISYEVDGISNLKHYMEDIYILYELSKNKIFVIKLYSKDFNITEKLINSINFKRTIL